VIGLFLYCKIFFRMKTLTKAEEQIMQVIWKLEKAFLREIIDELPNPKPHQNTVATILKILVEKEFVAVTVFGRTHQYYSLVNKDAYSKNTIKSLVKGYFEGSFSNAVSFMVKENNLSIEELELLLKQLKKNK
ncbi:MAG: BlaI/MecI/CopY family transcriptional regulator, partial [Ginsengibacter sp.]